MEIGSQQKGKRGEFFVFGELIKRGFDLYLPVIDVGIDAVVRLKNRTYIEIQVKTTQAKEQAGYFNVYDLEPRPNLFIICVNMSEEKQKKWGQPEVWILPSEEFSKYALKIPLESYTRYHLPLPQKDTRHGNRRRDELLEAYCANKHETAWELLTKRGEKPLHLSTALSEAADMCGYEIVRHDYSGDVEVWYTKHQELSPSV
jgi:hypothetical protein